VREHAFMRDYKATERGMYIEAFFRSIDCRMIERRLPETSALRLAS
jgi:superoxide dismutase